MGRGAFRHRVPARKREGGTGTSRYQLKGCFRTADREDVCMDLQSNSLMVK